MKILNYRVFEGRNIYAHKKCIKLELDLEGYSNIPSKHIEGFNDKLIALIPALKEHRCGIDEEGGFVKRLKEGTYLAHICEHVIIALHNMINLDISYGKAREISEERYYVVFQYVYPKTAVSISKLAVDIINSIINKKYIDINFKLNSIKKVLDNEILGPSTESICNAAVKREIPVTCVDESGIYQLGYGKYAKLIDATIVDDTKSIAVDISCDKFLTKKILKNQCVPVAEGGIISNSLELLIQAEAIGYPVVLKPRYGNQGRGVYLNLKNEKEALNAYRELKRDFKDIIIEKYVNGKDYRVCMVDGKVAAVSLRLPPFIVGNGKHTVQQLIKILNLDPIRGEGHEKPLTKVKVDSELLKCIAAKGYDIDSILEKDKKLYLRENSNLSTGGIAVDCTDRICNENIDICKRISKAIGLNVCGIDICCEDIGKPIYESGIIMEVNAAPGIRMHHYPYYGKTRDVAGAIVDMLFKNSPTSVPIVSITGTNGKTTVTRLVAHTLSLIGYNVGMTTTGGIYINNMPIAKGDTTGFESAKTILFNKDIDVAVLETARGGIIKKGLGYDLADVGVITNITDDHLGIDGVDNLEELAHVKSLIIEAVKSNGYSVLNADDIISMSIITKAKGNLILFSKDKNNSYLRENIYNGGYGVYIYNDSIYVERNRKIFFIAGVDEIPITLNGKLVYNIENALAACAALAGLQIDYCMIRKGLLSFKCDEYNNPGRFNIHEVNGRTIILDYGHNIDGYKAVINGAKKLKYNKFIGVIGVPGDRLDSNIMSIGNICGKSFDSIYIKEDKDKRGRKPGEVADLLEKGILQSDNGSKCKGKILDEVEALDVALKDSSEGDLIIVFFEEYEPLLKFIKEKGQLIKKIEMA